MDFALTGERMAGIDIRREGRIGHITLNRPGAMNALTRDMCLKIKAALNEWQDDAIIRMALIDGKGGLARPDRRTDRHRRPKPRRCRRKTRAPEQGDFAEGIRARVVDRDHTARWKHAGPDKVPEPDVINMLLPLRGVRLDFEGEHG